MNAEWKQKIAVFFFLCFGFFAFSAPGTADHDLLHAAAAGDTALLQKRLQAGADVNSTNNGVSALMLAAAFGRAEATEMLIAGGARIHRGENGVTPLMLASLAGNGGGKSPKGV